LAEFYSAEDHSPHTNHSSFTLLREKIHPDHPFTPVAKPVTPLWPNTKKIYQKWVFLETVPNWGSELLALPAKTFMHFSRHIATA